MADIVNLRQARKAKAREQKEQAAEANRVRFGRSKSERQTSELNARREAARLDAHKREPE